MYPSVKFHLTHPAAVLPTRATAGSGAFDLYAPISGNINPGQVLNIPMGFRCEMPRLKMINTGFPVQFHALMVPRSGLATKHGIRLFYEGLIDNDYRGEVHVCLENTSTEPYLWMVGERICQMLILLAFDGTSEQVSDLSVTSRGDGGFGSTGSF